MSECLFAETLYTGRKVIKKAYITLKGRLIEGVSSKKTMPLAGEYAVITPAFIDPHSHIGMERSGEPAGEGEANEQMESMLSLADALDSVQMDDVAFQEALEQGVLYSCVVPGSGNIVGGRSAVIRHYAGNGSEALISRAGLKAAFGYNPMSTVTWKGKRPSTRMGAMALFRAKLDEVRSKIEKYKKARGAKRADIVFSAEEKILRDLLEKKIRLRTHVHKTDDIAALLRLVDEFKILTTVEHALDVHRPEIYVELKRRRIPVIYGPVDAFAYKVELKHESWHNIRHLVQSKVHFGLMTDHPVVLSRQLFLQTKWFLRSGLNGQDAIELVSRKNAEVLGLGNLLGTIEKGKWASFICWSGAPFDLHSYPVTVYGEGKPVFRETD
jgi:imidazolonepropionase-like amidohydrolase